MDRRQHPPWRSVPHPAPARVWSRSSHRAGAWLMANGSPDGASAWAIRADPSPDAQPAFAVTPSAYGP